MPINVLSVLLGDRPVGTMTRNAHDGVEFRLLESYKSMPSPPVLGQQFLDDPGRVWRVRSRVPDWFSNLLPEGVLRELVAKQADVTPQREFLLLHHLGRDLPGAVRIVPLEGDASVRADAAKGDSASISVDTAWHFSLAGVQLKFSARESGRGLTIPVSGEGGNWIVKLPDARFDGVPSNEYATMRWAKESGIDVPDTRLLDLSDVSGLPEEAAQARETMAYAVRRFDRGAHDQRIHIEDFAQVLGLFPEEKYKRFNYETIANVVAALTGESGLREWIRRLVFVIASGNGDAHHKNWSLIYPDGVQARLSPAYDLVSTIQYLPGDQLALTLARSKRWEDVSIGSFLRLARKIGWPEDSMHAMVDEAIEAVLGAWNGEKANVGYTAAIVDRLEQHMRAVPLLAHK